MSWFNIFNFIENIRDAYPWILSTISGAFGGLLSIGVIYIKDKKLLAYKARQERHNLASALYTELTTFFQIYDHQPLSQDIPREGSAPSFLAFQNNYFVIYDNNAGKLGLFDNDTSKNIEELYLYLKALVDISTETAHRWNYYAAFSRTHLNQCFQNERENRLLDFRNIYIVALSYQNIVLGKREEVLNSLSGYMNE